MAYDLSALGSGLGGEGNVGLQETEGWVLERRVGLIREEGGYSWLTRNRFITSTSSVHVPRREFQTKGELAEKPGIASRKRASKPGSACCTRTSTSGQNT